MQQIYVQQRSLKEKSIIFYDSITASLMRGK